ncbi:putative histone-like transcription factor [Tieghemostelium lacteum]|uniref:Putative histone-like transcription factor n=1 Tax=Tieghemostelium lacteum TaxID=361077 RepID=A0A151Z6C1_TIELA|nr:putative histone-like transcription factor [Tieghemostelium lacteum]|eukprot:KYQ89344.1 putative histone-like transcription factor [Tieghemostelium lacteum]
MGDSNNDNLTLPKATVSKLIKEMLPNDIKCSNETRDMILECCVEFIHLISSEANDISGKDNKSTIGAEHVIKALNELGFSEYTQKVSEVYDKHKLEATTKKELKGSKKDLKPTEQLLAEQKLLFQQAKSAYNADIKQQQEQQQQLQQSPPQPKLE